MWELQLAEELAVRAELAAEGAAFVRIPFGITAEPPAAAVISDLLAKEADFFCIGTNALTRTPWRRAVRASGWERSAIPAARRCCCPSSQG
jgi:phosphoenolpyruvate synthase/pyruvate phosphate dikinase